MKIKNEDGLPKNICNVCQDKLLAFKKFKESVLAAQEVLHKTVEQQKPSESIDSSYVQNDGTKQENLQIKHVKKTYKCRFCKQIFYAILTYKDHLKIERDKRKELFSSCSVCKKLFTEGELKIHMKRHDKAEIFQCEMCGKKYKTKRNLSRHSLVHSHMPHVCKICGKGFREANLLRDHNNIHEGLTPYLCQICGNSYPTSSALRLHKAYKHAGKKRKLYVYSKKSTADRKAKKASFPCEICGKIYSSKATVNYHVLTHSGEKNFQCNDCGKMFANKSILGDHRRIHRLSYKCTHCDRSFAYAASLQTHINSHTGEKPHKCSICGKKYSNKSHLKEHTRNHTGERPYCCNICGKTFTAKGHLNGHLKIHKKGTDQIVA